MSLQPNLDCLAQGRKQIMLVMKAAGVRKIGGPVKALDLEERDLRDDEVLIEVRAAGVANWDEIVRTGGWDVGIAPPMALGVEASGVVRAVGSAVKRFRPGDAVLTHPLPLRHQGAWAERLIAAEDRVARKPERMSWEVASILPVPALTASQLVRQVGLQLGEFVLVNGGGGVTGGVIVAVAAEMGARVIATAGPASAERLRGYGAEAVLNYHDPRWLDDVRRLTSSHLPVAVNAVRGAANSLMPLVADGGRLATITGDPPAAQRGIRVTNFYVASEAAALEKAALTFAAEHRTIPVAARYGLAAASAALAAASGELKGGGVVISPSLEE